MAFNNRILRSTDVGMEETFLSLSIMNEETGEMYGFRCPFPETVHILLFSLNVLKLKTKDRVSFCPPITRDDDGLPVYNFVQVGGETRFIKRTKMHVGVSSRFARRDAAVEIEILNDEIHANTNDDRRNRFFAHFTSPDLVSILPKHVRVSISEVGIDLKIKDVYNMDYLLQLLFFVEQEQQQAQG